MSIEKPTTRETSRSPCGEVWQGQTGQPSRSIYRSGGVCGDGMSGRATWITRETCAREARASTGGTTPEKGEAATARIGVGVLHSSEEIPENGRERRRGSCADASQADREQGDGPQGIETSTVPETATRVRKLQRTLYRQAMKQPGEQPPRTGCGKPARPVR